MQLYRHDMPGIKSGFEVIKIFNNIHEKLIKHPDAVPALKSLADEIAGAISDVDSFIQRHTESICPECKNVCCINRFSYYDFSDLIYIAALFKKLPEYTYKNDNEICQFLSAYGCTINRSLRPYRCNWFFCSPLLEYISEKNPGKRYRDFIYRLEQITTKRITLINMFSKLE